MENRKKSPVVAYLIWLFFGLLGGHRYYFNKSRSAICMTLLVLLFGGLYVGLAVGLVWTLVDSFLIYHWLRKDRRTVESATVQNVLLRRQWR